MKWRRYNSSFPQRLLWAKNEEWWGGEGAVHAPAAMPREARGRRDQAGQSMPGSEEPEESESCQHCIIDEVERKGRGRGGGKRERERKEREGMAGS